MYTFFTTFALCQVNDLEISLINTPDISPCEESVRLDFQLNNSSGSYSFQEIKLELSLPLGLIYIDGSNEGISTFEPGSSINPSFIVSDISSFEQLTFNIEVRATCELQVTAGALEVTLQHDGQESTLEIENLNFRIPNLKISDTDNYFYAGVPAESFVRKTIVECTSIGDVYHLFFSPNYEDNGLELVDLNLPYSIDTLGTGEKVVVIDPSFFQNFGNQNGSFDIDDGSIVIEETLRIKDCSGGSGLWSIGYGCENEFCADNGDSEITTITVSEENTGLAWETLAFEHPGFCSPGTFQIEITNTGSITAKDIILEVGFDLPGTGISVALDDCISLDSFLVDAVGVAFDTTGTDGYLIDLSIANSGIGTNSDLFSSDVDGFLNDLPPGGSFLLTCEVSSIEECLTENTNFIDRSISLATTHVNYCGALSNDIDRLDDLHLDAGTQDNEDELEEEYSDGEIIDFILDLDLVSEEGLFEACENTGETEYFIVIPSVLNFPGNLNLFANNDPVNSYQIEGDTLSFFWPGYEASIDIDLEVACPEDLTIDSSNCVLQSQQRLYSIRFYGNYYCDRENCDSYLQIYDDFTDSFVVDCPNSSPENAPGLKNHAFTIKRKTLGWTDSNLNQFVNETDPAIRFDRSYTHDLVEIVVKGSVRGDIEIESPALEIRHYSGNTNNPDFRMVSDSISFFDSESNQWYHCTELELDSVATGGLFTYRYDLDPLFQTEGCFSDFELTENDTLTFIGIAQITNAPFPKMAPITQLTAGYTFQVQDQNIDCGALGANFFVADPAFDIDTYASFSNLSCDTIEIKVDLEQGGQYVDNQDMFPNEFRPMAIYDSLIVSIDSKLDYAEGSGKIIYEKYDPILDQIIEDTVPIPPPVIVTDGSANKMLHFINNGAYPNVDLIKRNTKNTLAFKVLPNCPDSEKRFHLNTFFQHRYYAKPIGFSEDRESNRARSSNLNDPQIYLNIIQEEYFGSSDTARWQVELCNKSEDQNQYFETVSNSWIELSTLSEVTPLGVRELYSNDTYYPFVQLGTETKYWAKTDTLEGGECRIFEISALLDTCDSFQINLEGGYACHNYPIHPDTTFSLCDNIITGGDLAYVPRPARVDIDLSKQPTEKTALCEPINYELLIINGQIGTARDLKVYLSKNQGMTILPGSCSLVLSNGSEISIPDPVTDPDRPSLLQWSLSNYPGTTLNETGLPGTVNAPENRVFLSFSVVTDCNFIPESTLNYSVSWKDACSEADKMSPVFFSQPLSILGAPTAVNSYNHAISQGSSYACAGVLPFTILLQNMGGSETGLTTSLEFVRIQLPAPASYQTGSYESIVNMPSNPDINVVTNDSLNWLEIPIQAGVLDGDSLIFNLNLLIDIEQYDTCSVFPIQIETRQLAQIPCATEPSGACNLSFLTSKGSYGYTIQKSNLKLSSVASTAIPQTDDTERWSGEAFLTNAGDYTFNDLLYGDIYLDLNGDGLFQENEDSLIYSHELIIGNLSPENIHPWAFDISIAASHACYGLHFVINEYQNCQCSTSFLYLPPPSLNNAGEDQLLCGSESATIGLPDMTGYTYEWSPTSNLSDPSASDPVLINNDIVSPGMETLLLYSLATTRPGGCTTEDEVSLTIKSIKLNLYSTTDYNGYDISCFGAADGAVSSSVESGYPPYSYFWNTGNDQDIDISELESGSYSLILVDTEGCQDSASITLSSPAPLTLSVETSDYNGFNTSCYNSSDGSISAQTNGGVYPYHYQWSNGNSSGNLINGLESGSYTLNVTDQNGCTEEIEQNIISPPEIVMVDSIQINPTCFGGQNGSISISLEGGIEPYLFGNDTLYNGILHDTLLSSGEHVYMFTDQNECSFSTEFNLIEQTSDFQITADSVSCYGGNDGSVQVIPTNGFAPFSYQWSSGAETEFIAGLPAGTYNVTVTDFNGCDYEFEEKVEQPQILSGDLALQTVSCYGATDGEISIQPTGGTFPYEIIINGTASPSVVSGLQASTYQLEITDFNSCSWDSLILLSEPEPLSDSLSTSSYNGYEISCPEQSDGTIAVFVQGGTAPFDFNWDAIPGNNDSLSNLSAGQYYFTITDQNNCTLTDSINLQEPDTIELNSLITNDPTCQGGTNGSIALILSGGVSPYHLDSMQFENNIELAGLSAGNYVLSITDDNGCLFEYSAYLTEQISTFALQVDSVDCAGEATGAMQVVHQDGYPPYSYQWNNGATSQIASNLMAGSYEVNIIDGNGCDYILAASVEEPLPLSGLISTVDIDCYGNDSGSIQVTPLGGTPFYEVLTDGEPSGNGIDQLPAGLYTIEIIDENACNWDSTIVLTQPDPIESELIITDVSCYGYTDGSIVINTTGGVPPYAFLWNDGAEDSQRNGLVAGLYNLSVVDAHECLYEASATINQPALPQPVLQTINPSCFGYFDGQITINGINPARYEYSLDDTLYQVANAFSNLGAGHYNLFLKDSIGCQYTFPFSLVSPPEQFITAYQDQTIKLGQEAALAIESELLIDSVFWFAQDSLIENTSNISVSPFQTTDYEVWVISEQGCLNEDKVKITVDRTGLVFAPNAFSPNGDGKNDFYTIYGGPAVKNIEKMHIFDRWGNLVFENSIFPANNPEFGWGGTFRSKQLNPGVFAMVAKVELIDGTIISIQTDVQLLK